MKVNAAGIFSMTMAEYLADPCETPSLSSSVACTLLQCSPLHARFAHPRLSPAYRPDEDERFDIGTAAHALMLEGAAAVEIIHANDYRSKGAREQRDAARALGRVPLLAGRWVDVQAMVESARVQLAKHEEPIPFVDGRAEQTLVWREENGVLCRARLDWLHATGHVCDYKTTSASANPDDWGRSMFGAGYDVQGAFYLRGLKAVTGVEGRFSFVVQEVYPPYALSVIGMTPAAIALASQKVEHAIRLWSECLERNEFPGYPVRTCYVDHPPWEIAKWESLLYRTPVIDDGRPLADQMWGSD